MAAIRGAATASATTPAAQPYLEPADIVNDPVGYPAAERYPGAVDATQYGVGSTEAPGGPAGPIPGSYAAEPFTASLPVQAPGGGWQDAAWLTGHDAPQVPWDSSAGEPFAPSGALNPELHGLDTGGVWQKQHVIPAEIGSLTRHTMTGQTFNRVANTQDTIGQTAPNDRRDLDQQQWHDPDGYDPWEIPYSERAIQNNLAYAPTAVADTGTAYGVAGQLSDRAPYDYGAQAYVSPSDPAVAQPQPQAAAGIGGGWVL